MGPVSRALQITKLGARHGLRSGRALERVDLGFGGWRFALGFLNGV